MIYKLNHRNNSIAIAKFERNRAWKAMGKEINEALSVRIIVPEGFRIEIEPLKVESLEASLRVVEYKPDDIGLWRNVKIGDGINGCWNGLPKEEPYKLLSEIPYSYFSSYLFLYKERDGIVGRRVLVDMTSLFHVNKNRMIHFPEYYSSFRVTGYTKEFIILSNYYYVHRKNWNKVKVFI